MVSLKRWFFLCFFVSVSVVRGRNLAAIPDQLDRPDSNAATSRLFAGECASNVHSFKSSGVAREFIPCAECTPASNCQFCRTTFKGCTTGCKFGCPEYITAESCQQLCKDCCFEGYTACMEVKCPVFVPSPDYTAEPSPDVFPIASPGIVAEVSPELKPMSTPVSA